jgi:hypothetical protein
VTQDLNQVRNEMDALFDSLSHLSPNQTKAHSFYIYKIQTLHALISGLLSDYTRVLEQPEVSSLKIQKVSEFRRSLSDFRDDVMKKIKLAERTSS